MHNVWLQKKINLRNQLEGVIFSDQFKKAKEVKPELGELETWMEDSEVGEMNVEDYETKLKELQDMLGEMNLGGMSEGSMGGDVDTEPEIEEVD